MPRLYVLCGRVTIISLYHVIRDKGIAISAVRVRVTTYSPYPQLRFILIHAKMLLVWIGRVRFTFEFLIADQVISFWENLRVFFLSL